MLIHLRVLAFVSLFVLGLTVAAVGCASEPGPGEDPYGDPAHHGEHEHQHHEHQHHEHQHEHDQHHHDEHHHADEHHHPDDTHTHEPQPHAHEGEIDGGYPSAEEAVDAAFSAILDLDSAALIEALHPEHRPMADAIVEANADLVNQIEEVEVTLVDYPEEAVAETEVEYIGPDGNTLGTEPAYSVEMQGRWFFVILDQPRDAEPQPEEPVEPHGEEDPFGE